MARILVAEDDRFTREMVERVLVGDGHEVTAAADGGEALAAYDAGPAFDLVVTDVEMPNMTGIALAEALIAKNAEQRIIVMSGLADELTSARDLARPTVRLITKPVTLEKIKSEVSTLLG
ncbi:MAG: CheY-like chemotaxis protein [Hyphomicrobiaceae bacterium]|jgi:CheY-like chemotaxis protein